MIQTLISNEWKKFARSRNSGTSMEKTLKLTPSSRFKLTPRSARS